MAKKKLNPGVFIKSIITGKILNSQLFIKNRFLILMMFCMAITSISVRYKSEKVIREMAVMEDSLVELRSNSISVAADVIKLSRYSMILDRVKKSGLDLEISKEPPVKIYVDKQ